MYARAKRYDPTRTTHLRNAFVRDLNKRFLALRGLIRKAVVEQDVFGLTNISTHALPDREAFAFDRSGQKVDAFMNWLRQQVNRDMLEIRYIQQLGTSTEAAWTNMYIQDSYKRGVIRARYEMKVAGYEVPSLEQTGGIQAAMQQPFHMDRVGLLYTRTFNDLRGITDAMDHQISRVLAEGMANGDGPALLARKMNAAISGKGIGDLGLTDTLGRFIPAQRRAQTLARTEMIRAHHSATIQEYKNWAVEGVEVQAEWASTGDDGRTCDECLDLDGSVYTLDEIERMIPLHPNCRCIALPVALKT